MNEALLVDILILYGGKRFAVDKMAAAGARKLSIDVIVTLPF